MHGEEPGQAPGGLQRLTAALRCVVAAVRRERAASRPCREWLPATALARFGAMLIAGALCLTVARESRAFCIATTCDTKSNDTCRTDENGCVIDGAPLHWATRCLSFGVQRDGSPLRHITYDQADAIIRSAFQQWMRADCDGKHPSFRIWDLAAPYGGIVCSVPQYNSLEPNANVWMFRDGDWPYEGESAILALTSTVFEKDTGELLDADVEINSFGISLTTTSENAGGPMKDLESIVTHEAGHFLGMGHSNVEQATMWQYYRGDLNYRSLAADDEAGICALYPPDRDTPECTAPSPPHGFSLYCGSGENDGTATASGCRCSLARKDGPDFTVVVAALTALGLLFRRR